MGSSRTVKVHDTGGVFVAFHTREDRTSEVLAINTFILETRDSILSTGTALSPVIFPEFPFVKGKKALTTT